MMYTGSPEGRNGVAIVVSQKHLDNIIEVKRISDRIMFIKVLVEGETVNILSAYAPQSGCRDSEKEAFWTAYDDILQQIPNGETCVVGADLNGHIGTKSHAFGRVHGGYGYGTLNDPGKTILASAISHELAIVNSFFKKAPEHLITYKSGPHSTQIDYILTNRVNIGRVKNCKVIPGECAISQHRIVVMDMTFRQKSRPKPERVPEITKWWLLKGEKAEEFRQELESVTINMEDDVNTMWKQLVLYIMKAGNKILGRTKPGRRTPKETWWWNASVQTALKDKKDAFKFWQTTGADEDREAYKIAKKAAKKAVAIERHNATGALYAALESREGQKEIYKISKARNKASQDPVKTRVVKGTDGTMLHKDKDVLGAWHAYYEQLLNTSTRTVSLPEVTKNLGLVPLITPQEVKAALKRMANKKSPGPDGIPIEVWKCLGEKGIYLLTHLFLKAMESSQIPDAWRLSTIIPLYKGKGSRYECNNYRGIKLMSHTMKLYERVIDARLRSESILSSNQYGFVPGLSTIDPMFAINMIAQEFRANNNPLYMAFLDMEKAFDRVPRPTIWWSLRKKNIPERYVDIIADMYKDVKSTVRTTVGQTAPIAVTEGVHQGSVLSPYLFCLVIDALTENAQTLAPWSFIYADDVAICSTSRNELEQALNEWKRQLQMGGLMLSVSKTQYMVCNKPGPLEDPLVIDGQQVTRCDEYKYLGTILHTTGDLEANIQHRIAAAWLKWRELTGVTCDRRMPVKLKGLVYKSMIRPVLTYGSETWAVTQRQVNTVQVAEMKMLRWMCGVTRLDKIRNEYVRGSLGVRDIADKLQESRLRWFGHVKRRPPEYIGNTVANLNMQGVRRRGRPKTRWLDVVRKDLSSCGVTESDTSNRAKWKEKTKKADPTIRWE